MDVELLLTSLLSAIIIYAMSRKNDTAKHFALTSLNLY